MKTTTIASLLVLLATALYAQKSIEVRIGNIREIKGEIMVAIFNNENDFLQKSVQSKSIKVSSKQVTIVFENLAPGDYAVSVIHDENSNGELDKNMVGMPKEGFGFGNNAMGTFGPPSFDKAKVQLKSKEIVQELILKYL